MKFITNFKKFTKIKESWTPPPPPPIEYVYQKPDTTKFDTISLSDALKPIKSVTERSLDSLQNLERGKDYLVVFQDDFTGKVLHEKIGLNFSDLEEIFNQYNQFNLESKNKFKIYDSASFSENFTKLDTEVKIKEGSIFIAFTQGDDYAIIYIDATGTPNFCGVRGTL
jgi:hypothetical protein